MKQTVTLTSSKYVMARRRINIALCVLEDGFYDLFSPQNVVELLTSALSDLDAAEAVEQSGVAVERGLDWNVLPFASGE